MLARCLSGCERERERGVQRSDDTEEKANNRIKVYHENMGSVMSYYTDQIVQVDGNVEMETVFEQVSAALDSLFKEPASSA